MRAHTKEYFEQFMSQLKETNATLGFYCDFEKINYNVETISIKLNQRSEERRVGKECRL